MGIGPGTVEELAVSFWPDRNVFVTGASGLLGSWLTEALLARETSREGHVVWVRPELVVEVAIDGVQTSTRYPGGIALRFARIRRYRPDKTPDQADTIGTLASLRG